MARLVCPRCSTKFQPPAAGPATCPSCGYSADVVPTSNPYGSPLATAPVAGPTPYGGGYVAPMPARVAPTRNGLAVGSLVTGILGIILWILAPVALTLGIVAARQIKRDRNRGLGMAITGIVFGALVCAVFAFVFTMFALDEIFGVI